MKPMFKIAITQREISDPSYHEVRDALARDWWDFFEELNLPILPILIPSHLTWAQTYWQNQKFDGLILSGGNDLGDAPQRDEVELWLLQQALQSETPVLGVCRGAQLIGTHLGLKLTSVNKDLHVAQEHSLHWTTPNDLPQQAQPPVVNSYHGQGLVGNLPSHWQALAHSPDQELEAFAHRNQKCLGILWHPERTLKTPLLNYHKSLFQHLFCET